MRRLRTIAAVFCITLFVVLPLYELADYGEHWHHDGDYASMVLAVLFLVGLALVLRLAVTLVVWREISALAAVFRRPARSTQPHAIASVPPSILRAADIPRFLILRDFRI